MKSEDQRSVPALDRVREDLAGEFLRAAQKEPRRASRTWRAWLGIGLIVVAIPTTLAAADMLQDEHTIHYDGSSTRIDGELIECPADRALAETLGFDPCDIGKPAPPPKAVWDARERRSGASAERESLEDLEGSQAP